ncbi:hypothetical protein C0995_006617 [Termitomyces sp. Mi166|nr:hypothetical protein C0995_006617 [Termitomyces sp. Mi166\
MASLNKLAIRGIRSFDDKHIAVIEFFSPVTVIVGHNGSGKTTIIECLKYATTGDQPPNTRGGAFVHDPKMANEKEVKAQVKLRFHAANGTRMLAVRNLSVTVKKTSGFTMKTLESILALADGNAEKDGKRGVISTKCAEMDTEIPQLLGVSKAVLENVIFCHQEDSWWPLAEPSALKKKFDDIFEATRYTKALESIKNLRKDRVADLKAENERLQSLAREKAHADKLKERIFQLNAAIAEKQVEYEQTKKEHEAIVEANQKFYDYATKFRELFVKYEALDGHKARLQADLDEIKLNLQEFVGSDEELELRLRRFDEHINAKKQRQRVEDAKRQDLEDELANVRRQHTEFIAQHGGLVVKAEAQDQRLAERERLIHEIAERHGIKGFSVTPLERDKVVDFLSRLNEMKNKHRMDLEKLQSDLRDKTEDYAQKQRMMDNELNKHKLEKENLREQIVQAERQKAIKRDEHKIENLITIPSQLKTLQGDMNEKRARLTKHKTDMGAAQYDARLTEVLSKVKALEDRRELLNNELRTLGLQTDVRAKLNLAKEDIKTKDAEILNTLELANVKIHKLTKGKDMTVDTLESEVNRLTADREQRCEELERLATTANNNLSKAEATISNAKTQLKTKKDELKGLEKQLKNEFEGDSLEVAIKDAASEAGHRRQTDGNLSGGGAIYTNLLRVGRLQKICGACNRHLTNEEFKVFEKNVSSEDAFFRGQQLNHVQMEEMKKKASPEAIEENKKEMKEWEEELERLQSLRPVEAACHQLKTKEIPALEKEINELEDSYPNLTREAEEAADNLETVKRELREIGVLKEHTKTITRLRGEVSRAKDDVTNYETELQASGSIKTADDVQRDLDDVTSELRSFEREKSQITTERERQKEALRLIENSIHEMEMKEKDLTGEAKEMEKVEKSIAEMQQEIITSTQRTKELDVKIMEARAPIDALEEERRKSQNDMNGKISQAQQAAQEFNSSVDKLALTNKDIERYVKDRRARELTECAQNIEHSDTEIKKLSEDIEAVRTSIAALEKEIGASGTSVINYRSNVKARALAKELIDTQAKMDACNLDEAAKAKRNFEEKYPKAKEKENKLRTNFSHIAGEVSSHQSQLKALEADLKEFKNINKKYTEQLIRVKANMANSDLEKYAKALDNAIMKYHGLKMEEVNDTMKHLWNKTYQGTGGFHLVKPNPLQVRRLREFLDIDGIKIRSDVEGGASKRSYNYRVVMTKDQVEMDMRGRCSAGQKMLASIIIRLALSDSFGQNCGILALDEPTNALDTENIDALAASLVEPLSWESVSQSKASLSPSSSTRPTATSSIKYALIQEVGGTGQEKDKIREVVHDSNLIQLLEVALLLPQASFQALRSIFAMEETSSEDLQELSFALQSHEKLDALLLAHLLAQESVPDPSLPQDNSSPISTFLSLLPGPTSDELKIPLPNLKPAISPEIAIFIYSRFSNNNFAVHSHLTTIGHAPKYLFTKAGVVMEVVALREILLGEEICIPYLDPAMLQTRQRIFEFTYGFKCTCPSCVEIESLGSIPSPPNDPDELSTVSKSLRAFVGLEWPLSDLPRKPRETIPRSLYCVFHETYLSNLSEVFSKASHDFQFELAVEAGVTLLGAYILIYPPNYPQIGVHLLELAKTTWNTFVSSETRNPDTAQASKETARLFLNMSRKVLVTFGQEGDAGGPLSELDTLQSLLES